MRFLYAVTLLLGTLALASPVEKRRSGSRIHPRSGTPVIQWTSANGNLNNVRNYHIHKDGSIMESRRTSDGGDWQTVNTGLKARSNGPLVAGVHKRSEARDDVEIRLFYQDPQMLGRDQETNLARHRQLSSIWRPGQGWKVDQQFFDQIGYLATPQSVVSWAENGIVQWRMYFLSSSTGRDWSWAAAAMNLLKQPTNPYVLHTFNTIYEARFPASADAREWTMGNGGAGIATSQHMLSDTGAVVAAVWRKASRISVVYWDTNGVNDFAKPGEIKEIRWKAGEGWIPQPRPNDDFKNFSKEGSLALVTWVDGAGVDQLRLYAKWSRDPFLGIGATIVEFSAGANGWGKQSSDFAKWATANTKFFMPMSAVAWTYPDANNVHIRVHQPNDPNSGATHEGWVHEFTYDTGKGWMDGPNIDY